LKTKGKKFISLKSKALTLQDFEGLMEEAGIYLYIFGDYKLKKFYKNESERLIMILNS
jgi:hypothetical protein